MDVQLRDQFQKIFLHEDSKGSELAERVLVNFPKNKIEWVKEKPQLSKSGTLSAQEYDQSKRLLYITPFRGAFFKPCPGAQGVACCNYMILNLGLQCNMNCSYCYLQSYINSPLLTLYSNIEDAIGELETMATKHPDHPFRVGTGEVMDSLSMDDLTLFSRKLIPFFSKYPKWTLEFKTKSAKVEQFLDMPHARNVVVAWSINPEYIVQREEHGTASLKDRLAAARRCRDKGFRIGFHIDPMIWHPEWKANYEGLVDQIAAQFEPGDVPYIGVGALRYQSEQRHMMRERFGLKSLITSAEMFQGKDGKLRYDQEMRNQMFQALINQFKKHSPEWKVWLCMENNESWLSVFNATPREIKDVAPLFKPLPSLSRSSSPLDKVAQ